MIQEKNSIIDYHGNQINLYSDERNDYVNLTDIAKAWRGRKSIRSWMRNRSTLEFLGAWERKNNPNFNGAHLGTIENTPIDRDEISIKFWIDQTNAIGIFTRKGGDGGTYAHKDIAIKFAGWLSPEFELYLVEEIQRLKKLEEQKNSYELLTHEQILALIRLKEVFKYVAHQEIIEDAHKEVFAAHSNSKYPFAEFHTWRNKILDIDADTINARIKEYCKQNGIAVTKAVMKKSKREKILMFDSYEAVRHAVWDFLDMKGEVNALNLANLVRDIIRTEKGEIFRVNEDNLFDQKQDLGEYADFHTRIGDMPEVKTARELLARREEQKKMLKDPTTYDKVLKGLLSVPPPSKKKG